MFLLRHYLLLKALYNVWYCLSMNEIQARIARLRAKGWTIAAIADELEVTRNAVEKWTAADRTPSNRKSTLQHLDRLLQRRHIPKKRRY